MRIAIPGSPVVARPASGLTSTMSPCPRRRIFSPIASTSRIARLMSRSTIRVSTASAVAPLEPLDDAVDRAILRCALVISALDLRRPCQRAQKFRHQPGIRQLRIVPERIERQLAGQAGDIENRVTENLDRNALLQGGHA